jgi:nitroreductase
MESTAYNATRESTSFRGYSAAQKERGIDSGVINRLLYAAMSAPAPLQYLPWKFIAITDRPTLGLLANRLPFAAKLSRAVADIVVCAVVQDALLENEAMAIINCTCASQNIILTAQAMGYSTAWTSLYPDEGNMNTVREMLQIPAHVIPLNILPLVESGYNEKAKSKYDAGSIFREKWNKH